MSINLRGVNVAGGMFAGDSTSSPSSDPYFNSVTLLAQFQGTNESTLFVDSSQYNLSMSVNSGTPIISTSQHTGTAVSSLYSSTATQSSISFDNSSGAVNFTGDFTLEAYTYLLSVSGYPTIIRANTGSGYMLLRANSGNYELDMNGTKIFAVGAATTNVGAWTHLAVCRTNSTVTLYVNGVAAGTAAKSGTIGGTGGTACISWNAGNEWWNGYLQDVRVTNGVARYTSAFTLPTTLFPTN